MTNVLFVAPAEAGAYDPTEVNSKPSTGFPITIFFACGRQAGMTDRCGNKLQRDISFVILGFSFVAPRVAPTESGEPTSRLRRDNSPSRHWRDEIPSPLLGDGPHVSENNFCID